MANNHEWLKSLKPGDKVAMKSQHHTTIQEVERLTKTQIILKCGWRFHIDSGYQVSGDSWNFLTIEPVTKEVIQKLRHDSLKVKVGWIDFKSLPADKLERILAIVEEG